MSNSYLERYLNGEYVEVWRELLALGAEIRDEPLFTDAKAVAQETMRRAKKNIETIVLRLIDLDFEFAEPDYIFTPSTSQELLRLANFEQTVGPLPLALSEWYRICGEVCLMGNHPDLTEYNEIESYETDSGLNPFAHEVYQGPLSDPLVIFPIEASLGEIDDFSNFELPLYFMFSPDAIHKANYSGGGPTLIEVPNLAIDGPLLENWVGYTFVEHLRETFRWGGFPGLADSPNPPKAILEFLTKDLLPI